MVIEKVLEYGKAMAQFCEMSPKISPEFIEILARGKTINLIKRRNDVDVESTMEMLLAISSDEDRFLPLFEVNDDAKDRHGQEKAFSRSPCPPSSRVFQSQVIHFRKINSEMLVRQQLFRRKSDICLET